RRYPVDALARAPHGARARPAARPVTRPATRARRQRRLGAARPAGGARDHVDRPLHLPPPARRRESADRSHLVAADQPRVVRGPAPPRAARPALRGPAADPRGADLARPLRPPRPRHRPAPPARPPADLLRAARARAVAPL